MKLSELIVFVLILTVSVNGINSCLKISSNISEELYELRNKEEMLEFISKSFRNTCEGHGFSSLNQWQKSCRALWNLTYIAWADAEEFMIVRNSDEHKLYYGKWERDGEGGEVFCRM